MRPFSTRSWFTLSCAALVLSACGEPLASLPANTTAAVFLDVPPEPGVPGFATLRLDGPTCLQLADGTAARLNDVPADDVTLGGRGGNPLAAYIDVGCSPPSASWFELESAPPFVFALSSGDVTLEVELDEAREAVRCDFPACVSEGSVRLAGAP